MKRKTVFIAALIVCAIAILACGSLAFFSASKQLNNEFMITNYDPQNPDPDPDDIFSIYVYETDENNQETTVGREYSDIAPGSVLAKDPTVRNTGDYSAWIRVNVTVTEAAAWKAACARHNVTDLATIFGGHDEAIWTRASITEDTANDTITYTYYLNNALAADAEATLFETVAIPSAFDQNDMATLPYFEMNIVGEAIQSNNTGATPADAFVLYDAQLNP